MMLVVRPSASLGGPAGPGRTAVGVSSGPVPRAGLELSRAPHARRPISALSRLLVPWRAPRGAWAQRVAAAAPSAAATAWVVLSGELALAVVGASHARHGHPAPEG